MSVKQSLKLVGEKEGLVKASRRVAKKIMVSTAKTAAALKSHSETERRRRERINAHFATLRGLVLSNEKMDKATLLAEVINKVKQLKETATQATENLLVPTDTDEVEVEKLEENEEDGSLLLRCSICCDCRPDLLSDLRQAMKDVPVQLLKCEISTLGGRVKSVFLLATSEQGNKKNSDEHIEGSVHTALSNIVDKVSASAEFDEELIFPRKRQRVSNLDSSCLSP
ncbi:hypothetical protein BUALT_Bualt03G0046500 [Buddleja alternifolia]|uniref:BHLH domain-containing protein n=1 Tax=Buddleja alternifolia TaxID=168488 RepID=A0AAV6Y1Y0_9LAMI|nr:hypothetical protein BUALT_Bualt03G0046500 [Buddleja alternifolia]